MTLKFKIRHTTAAVIFLTLFGLLACKKNETLSSAVELLSFGPAGVSHGEQIRFIGNNLDQVTAIDLVGANIPNTAFVEQSRELIVITVPQEAEYGVVTLKTPSGDIVSKTPLNLEVPVVISKFTPSVKPGETLTINGEFLNWVSAVTFAGEITVSTFENQSRTELQLQVPLEAQSGQLTLSCGGTDPIELTSEMELDVILPSKLSFSPNPVRHESELTITGADLDLVKGILFTGLETPIETFVSQTEDKIVVTIPEGVNNGVFSLVTFSGISIESVTPLGVVLPTVTALVPNPVERGAMLTLTGTELKLVTGVQFKGMEEAVTTFISQTDTEIKLVVPEAANKGTLTLSTRPLINVESTVSIEFIGDLPPLEPLGFTLYADQLENNAQDWGWGQTADFNNADNVRDGTTAIKIVYRGEWGAIKFANFTVNTTDYKEVTFSLFGTAGTQGKTINLTSDGGTPFVITITEGEWVTYSLSLSELGDPATLTNLAFQETGWSGTVYMDHVGLR